jgi:hypothetical protein
LNTPVSAFTSPVKTSLHGFMAGFFGGVDVGDEPLGLESCA